MTSCSARTRHPDVYDPEATPRWSQLNEPLAPSTLATWEMKKQRAVFSEA
jgi:hypothetical protein